MRAEVMGVCDEAIPSPTPESSNRVPTPMLVKPSQRESELRRVRKHVPYAACTWSFVMMCNTKGAQSSHKVPPVSSHVGLKRLRVRRTAENHTNKQGQSPRHPGNKRERERERERLEPTRRPVGKGLSFPRKTCASLRPEATTQPEHSHQQRLPIRQQRAGQEILGLVEVGDSPMRAREPTMSSSVPLPVETFNQVLPPRPGPPGR